METAYRSAFWIVDQLDDYELASFPETANRLIQIRQRSETNAEDIIQVFECDACLTMRLLGLANQYPREADGGIESIQQAIDILGPQCVIHLTTAIAGAQMFAGGKAACGVRMELWAHSLGCAIVAQELAVRSPSEETSPAEAFLAGIFHDMGKLVLLDLQLDPYTGLLTDFSSGERTSIEPEIFGISHAEIGARCARQWGLSSEVQTAIANHHHPEQATDSVALTRITYLANVLAKQWQIGTDLGRPEEFDHIPLVPYLSEDELPSLRHKVESHFNELHEVLSFL